MLRVLVGVAVVAGSSMACRSESAPDNTKTAPQRRAAQEEQEMTASDRIELSSMEIQLKDGTRRRGMLNSPVTVKVRGEKITINREDNVAVVELTPGPRWTIVRLNDRRSLKGTLEESALAFRDANGPDFTIAIADLKTMGFGVASRPPPGWAELEPLPPAPASFDCGKITEISGVTTRYMSRDRMVAVGFGTAPPLIVVDPDRPGLTAGKGIDVFAAVVSELGRCKGSKRTITATSIAVDDLVAGEAWSKPGDVVTTSAIRIGAWQAPRTISEVTVSETRRCPGGTSREGLQVELSAPIVDACAGRASCDYVRADFFAKLPKEAGTVCQATFQISWRCPEEAAPRVVDLKVEVTKPLKVRLDCAPR